MFMLLDWGLPLHPNSAKLHTEVHSARIGLTPRDQSPHLSALQSRRSGPSIPNRRHRLN